MCVCCSAASTSASASACLCSVGVGAGAGAGASEAKGQANAVLIDGGAVCLHPLPTNRYQPLYAAFTAEYVPPERANHKIADCKSYRRTPTSLPPSPPIHRIASHRIASHRMSRFHSVCCCFGFGFLSSVAILWALGMIWGWLHHGGRVDAVLNCESNTAASGVA